MGAGAVKWPSRWPRPKRWQLVLILLAVASGATWLYQRHISGGVDAVVHSSHQKPPVGAYSFNDRGDGKADFAMQTETGRFGLRVGSQDPEDLPYGFPLYPGAKLANSANLKGAPGSSSGRYVQFTTADPPEQVAAYYRSQARMAVLRVVTDQHLDGMAVLSGLYPDGRDGGFQLSARRIGKGSTEATLSSGFGIDVTDLPEPDSELANMLSPSEIANQVMLNSLAAAP